MTDKTLNPLFISSMDLTFDEFAELLNDEVAALDGLGWIASGGSMREAYANRSKHRRCVCCGAYIAAHVTGEYDGETCWSCGNAQETPEAEQDGPEGYDAVCAKRCTSLRRCYAKVSYRSKNYSRARKVTNELRWISGRPGDNVFPAHAVRQIRAEFAILNGSN